MRACAAGLLCAALAAASGCRAPAQPAGAAAPVAHDGGSSQTLADAKHDEAVEPTDPDAAVTETHDAATAGAQTDGQPASTADAAAQWYQPDPASTWAWQLQGQVDTSVVATVHDIDLFDSPTAVVASLHAKGRKVICYFSAGTAANWRPDFAQFAKATLGKPLHDWAGERWLDIRAASVRTVLLQRMLLAKTKGCDAVEPDNVDGYAHQTGFALTPGDQLAFNLWLAETAHDLNLGIGLKNDGDQAAQLVGAFDFALNEECHQYDECSQWAPFVAANKAVFNAEYAPSHAKAVTLAAKLCPLAVAEHLLTLVLPLALDGSFRVACNGP